MKSLLTSCLLTFALGLSTGCSESSKTADTPAPATAPAPPAAAVSPAAPAQAAKKGDVAVIKTSDGEMVVEFWPEVAPKTVENFITLAKKGFYDGTAFHRIMKGFMIQGGDPNTKDPAKESMYGQGGPGYSVKAEFNNRPHEVGVISMARSNDPDSAGSQFFICDAPPENPGMQYLNGKYTAFGKLIKGQDVLEKLAGEPVGPNAFGEPSKPVKRVDLISIKIVPADSIK